ncbi:MAG: gliding motility protein GldC [Flavobacteriales bacterium]|nr:MAG: gliding motility protein GldC [Flavobacteriales bacterium]
MATKHTSEVLFKVHLDENRIPETIEWSAQDGGITNAEAKAFLVSVWDSASNETLKMDLWTKDMPLQDMKMFFYQTFLSLSDTFYKATQDDKMTATIKDFAQYFAEKMELIDDKNDEQKS